MVYGAVIIFSLVINSLGVLFVGSTASNVLSAFEKKIGLGTSYLVPILSGALIVTITTLIFWLVAHYMPNHIERSHIITFLVTALVVNILWVIFSIMIGNALGGLSIPEY